MRTRNLVCAIAIAAALTGCGQSRQSVTEKEESPAPVIATESLAGGYVLGEPLQHANLVVYPVISKSARDDDRFITLDEGLQSGVVEVFEVGARPLVPASASEAGDNLVADAEKATSDDVGREDEEMIVEEFAAGDVNRLLVVNRADKPLYLMPGQVIVGGSQDRTVAQSAIIAAHSAPTEIDVYCVEHGRWGQRDSAEAGEVILAFSVDPEQADELIHEANSGKFVKEAGLLNKGSRVAAADHKGQQEVWDEVAKANGKLNVNSASGAFTYNFVDQDVQAQLQPYVTNLESLSQQDCVVGVIVAINGRPETADVFESTPLFRKFWPKLLKGYSLDALHAADEEGAAATCGRADAEAFLASILPAADESAEDSSKGLVVSRRESDKSVSFSAGGSGMMGGMGMGGMGGAVHSSGFSK